MSKAISMRVVSPKKTLRLHPQLHGVVKETTVPLYAGPEPGPASFPPLIGAPVCRLTEEEWERINRGMLLTPRELDVVKGILIGTTEAGIAVQLGISTNTVHTHLGRIYKKLGVHGASTLILRVFAAYVQCGRSHEHSHSETVVTQAD